MYIYISWVQGNVYVCIVICNQLCKGAQYSKIEL